MVTKPPRPGSVIMPVRAGERPALSRGCKPLFYPYGARSTTRLSVPEEAAWGRRSSALQTAHRGGGRRRFARRGRLDDAVHRVGAILQVVRTVNLPGPCGRDLPHRVSVSSGISGGSWASLCPVPGCPRDPTVRDGTEQAVGRTTPATDARGPDLTARGNMASEQRDASDEAARG